MRINEDSLIEAIKMSQSACKKCNVKFTSIDVMLTAMLELAGKIAVANSQASVDKEPLGHGDQLVECEPDDCLTCEFLDKIDKQYPHELGIELKCKKKKEPMIITYYQQDKLIEMQKENTKHLPPEWCPIRKCNDGN